MSLRNLHCQTQHYLSLQFFGHHTPDCHYRMNLTGCKSAPGLGGHKSYYGSGGDSDNVESGKSSIEFFVFSTPSLLPLAALMETRVWFGAKPRASHSVLCTRLSWVAPSWTCCATRKELQDNSPLTEQREKFTSLANIWVHLGRRSICTHMRKRARWRARSAACIHPQLESTSASTSALQFQKLHWHLQRQASPSAC